VTLYQPEDRTARSYRIEQHRDFISGFNFRLTLTGPSVGGYGVLNDSFGAKFEREEDARLAGETWNQTGLLPAFQTGENIAAHCGLKDRRAA
jgi:hypothetical protein